MVEKVVGGLLAAIMLAAGAAHPARAVAEERPFCAERPGQTTPPCVVAPGRLMLETSPVGWTRDGGDTWLAGSTEARLGVARATELQLGWIPWGRRGQAHGGGDVTVGVLQNFGGGGEGPAAVQAFATLPTGGAALGAGDWGAGVRLPVQLDLPHHLQLALTPEADAAVNGSGAGRHLAFGGAAGIGAPLGSTVQLALDVAAFRDRDPAGHATRATAGLSLAWQARPNLQLDLGGTAGLTRASPRAGLYVGVAGRL